MTLTLDKAGERLDSALSRLVPELTRSQAQRLIEQGAVTRDGRPVKKNEKLPAGTTLELAIPEVRETPIAAQEIPLEVCYEDADVIVVNKPKGLVVHPAPGHADGTLVNALLAHCGNSLSGIGVHGGDLLADLRGGERVEIGVIISMVRKLVPLVHNALQRLRVVRGAVARDEECRLHAARGQLVEQSRRVWPWAVVKRDGQQLRPAIQTFCLTNWGETGQNRRQKQQNGQNSLPFPHGKHLDSFTHHSRICKI